MATLEEQVASLLERRVSDDRTGGRQSSDAEARSVFDLVTMNLIVHPKSVYYITYLARNGLARVVADEISLIDDIKAESDDLANTSRSIQETGRLEKTLNILRQIGLSRKVDTSSGMFTRFDSSINDIFEKDLATTLRKPQETSMVRPGDEAAADMLASFSDLKATHSELLERLYALPVGAINFLGSAIRGLVGLTTADRMRRGIQDHIDTINSSGSVQITRELATELIAGRAALKAVGNPPDPSDALISSLMKLPKRYEITAVSDPASAKAITTVGPYLFGASWAISVEDAAGTIGPFNFPQDGFDMNGKAWIVGEAVVFPVTVPADAYLFISITTGGVTTYKKIAVTQGSRTLANIVTDIEASADISAREFAVPGSSRIAVIADTADSIEIHFNYVDTDTGQVWEESIADLIGMSGGMVGTADDLKTELATAALNEMFGTILTTRQLTDDTIELTGVDNTPGAFLTISGTAAASLGVNGTFLAKTDIIRLIGKVDGAPTDPIDPTQLLSPDDLLSTPDIDTTVKSLTPLRVTLVGEAPTFSGNITAQSPLVGVYVSIVGAVNDFLSKWSISNYAENLDRVDRFVASAIASRTLTMTSGLSDELDTLRSLLVDLLAGLSRASSVLPGRSAPTERDVVNGILSSFVERKYDRAESMFLKAMILETLLLDGMTASFGGNAQKSVSDFAKNDIGFPDRSKDEGFLTREAGVSGAD